MATAPVTLTLADLEGGHLAGKHPEIIFTLNRPNAKAGKMLPTEPVIVSPPDNGVVTANLESTTDMMDHAWYTISIRWLDAEGKSARRDYPDWQLQVPTSGGSFHNLFGRPPENTEMFYVSLSPPDGPIKFTKWLQQNPEDPFDPLNTGDLFEWQES